VAHGRGVLGWEDVRRYDANRGTSVPALYQTERWNDGGFQYQFSVPNGTYTVNLKFAEINFAQPGQRRFGVAINGQMVLTDFDIFVAAGGAFKAVDRRFTTSVSNGQITIQFLPGIENPKVSAIEILPGSIAAAIAPSQATLWARSALPFQTCRDVCFSR